MAERTAKLIRRVVANAPPIAGTKAQQQARAIALRASLIAQVSGLDHRTRGRVLRRLRRALPSVRA